MKLVSINLILIYSLFIFIKGEKKCCENCNYNEKKVLEIPKSNNNFCLETCADDKYHYKINLLSYSNINKSNMITNPCNELGYTKYIITKDNYDYYTNKKLKVNNFNKYCLVR